MKKAYVLFENAPANIYPSESIVAIGDSVAALIDFAIAAGVIDESTQITPTDITTSYFLGEYFPKWKTELNLLTKNEFNDWFEYSFLEIEDYTFFEKVPKNP